MLLLSLREAKAKTKGAGLRILTQTVTSPTLADQLRRLQEQFPEAKWHAYEPDHARRRSRRLPAGVRRRAGAGLSSGQGRRDRRSRRRLSGVGTGPAQGCAGLRRAPRAEQLRAIISSVAGRMTPRPRFP